MIKYERKNLLKKIQLMANVGNKIWESYMRIYGDLTKNKESLKLMWKLFEGQSAYINSIHNDEDADSNIVYFKW